MDELRLQLHLQRVSKLECSRPLQEGDRVKLVLEGVVSSVKETRIVRKHTNRLTGEEMPEDKGPVRIHYIEVFEAKLL
jgi:hypothetical protein